MIGTFDLDQLRLGHRNLYLRGLSKRDDVILGSLENVKGVRDAIQPATQITYMNNKDPKRFLLSWEW